MMTKIKALIGMPGVTPVLRTALQAALAVLVASGTGFVSVAVWKAAALAGGAALLAKLQAVVRG